MQRISPRAERQRQASTARRARPPAAAAPQLTMSRSGSSPRAAAAWRPGPRIAAAEMLDEAGGEAGRGARPSRAPIVGARPGSGRRRACRRHSPRRRRAASCTAQPLGADAASAVGRQAEGLARRRGRTRSGRISSGNRSQVDRGQRVAAVAAGRRRPIADGARASRLRDRRQMLIDGHRHAALAPDAAQRLVDRAARSAVAVEDHEVARCRDRGRRSTVSSSTAEKVAARRLDAAGNGAEEIGIAEGHSRGRRSHRPPRPPAPTAARSACSRPSGRADPVLLAAEGQQDDRRARPDARGTHANVMSFSACVRIGGRQRASGSSPYMRMSPLLRDRRPVRSVRRQL